MAAGFVVVSVTLVAPKVENSRAGESSALGLVPDYSEALSELRQNYRRPRYIPFPKDAPYSPQLAMLGKKLFFDPRLSKSKTMSCATCHNPSFGFEAPVDHARGAKNTPLKRHAPTLQNLAWTSHFFWDGRARTLEDQAQGPITAADEMGSKMEEVIETLRDISEYAVRFNQIYPGEGVTSANILKAIATYERTIVSPWSPFDRWVEGDDNAITTSALKGFQLFNGKAGCASCHSGWNFSDNKFHDIGLDTDDPGRATVTPDKVLARHAFKTPTLRNVTRRAPFMHNGAISTIQDVIDHYASGGIERPSRSNFIKAVNLDEDEKNDLVAFLKSLSTPAVSSPVPNLPN